MRITHVFPATFALLVCLLANAIPAHAANTLETELAELDRSNLVKRARIYGDPMRGSILFYRQGLSCIQCHTAGEGEKLLGPDLSKLSDRATYEHVIESLLQPSKVVREGYKTEKLLLISGKVIVGMVRQESDDEITIVVPGEEAARVILLDDIEARAPAGSIMPSGLVNQLSDENMFFDLASFLVALGKAGPHKAASLKPEPALIAQKPLPEYELDLDHAGLIRSWNNKSLSRGKALYNGLCINCHGTKDQPGSLPNALRFASGKFRNGSDPHSMYKTVTNGYGMMLPQRQLVPQQKYDVIYYIRETYLKPHNPSQLTTVDKDYLAKLPQGNKRGPAPIRNQPWREMDYGPFLISTYEMNGPETKSRPEVTQEDKQRAKREGRPAERVWPENTNFAYKGVAIQLDTHDGGVAAGSHWIAFDHDTMRVAGAWSGDGFIDWQGILFDGKHWRSPRTVGKLHFSNPSAPGWAHPVTGSFDDPRQRARDGQAYGPLPRDWVQYKGLYKNENRAVLSYRVGNADVLESHRIESQPVSGTNDGPNTWIRILNVGKSATDLRLRVAPEDTVTTTVHGPAALNLNSEHGYTVVRIPAEQTPVNFEVRIAGARTPGQRAEPKAEPEDLRPLTLGGPAQWPQTLSTSPQFGGNRGPFEFDTLTRPVKNPWNSRLRMSGLDFFPDGKRMVACCCDGDVWIVGGINKIGGELTWRRIASGLFHPLGVKIVGGRIHVSCRDQIVVLIDLNGDGETDFYECFNDDHQVTEHFHEFAMGLQADAAGNFYYAKSARHAADSLVPQHGTLLKVSADGRDTTIIANGFRAANGVCLNPDGSFFVTDQEGHWTPMNRINRVVEGGFYGNMYSFGAPDDTNDSAMEQPLCWPNKPLDRSPAELVWVESEKWGPLDGSLLSLSYGYGKVFVVPHEEVDGQWQGGICRLPLPDFPTGIMRARFHPRSGHMYACGMHAWGSSQDESSGGLYRIRRTGKPMHLPIGLHAHQSGITIKFTEPVDPDSASDVDNYLVETWALKRTSNYGSGRYDEQILDVTAASVSADGYSVTLDIPDIEPTWSMQIAYKLNDAQGDSFHGMIQNTIHRLAERQRLAVSSQTNSPGNEQQASAE